MEKLPLGVMPKNIYELKRVKDLSRALYEYSNYHTEGNYDLMIKWAEELVERLSDLKFEKEYGSENIMSIKNILKNINVEIENKNLIEVLGDISEVWYTLDDQRKGEIIDLILKESNKE